LASAFGEASGLSINIQKSSLFFSPNTPVTPVEKWQEIRAVLRMRDMDTKAKYLGLPTLWEGSKKESMSFIRDNIMRKIRGWKDSQTNQAGKKCSLNQFYKFKEREGRKEERRDREKHKKRDKRGRERKHRVSRREGKGKASDTESGGYCDSKSRVEPEGVVRFILKEFPGVAADLEQLLQMIDGGQAVDISGLSQKSLVKHLKKLFQSLNLKENGNQVFLLPPNVCPTLEIVGPIIHTQTKSRQQQSDYSVSPHNIHSAAPDEEYRQGADDNTTMPHPNENVDAPRRRVIGPEMPSAELLAAAAKLTEAEAELREAEVEEDNAVFIGPPPPAVVTEAESANEAERFEEVTRILGAEVDSPYDILGVNRNMSTDNTKKRYWKLSLMVHPDKCPHPQANQAFIKLNKAFKDLQDPEKRKALDEKIRLKEEQEEFKAELKAMREAAQWRRLQGISMEGDDVLLAEMDVKVGQKEMNG
ncbi:hypothetical protein C3L33_21689, partial [Rhododendron williamsianum]